MKTFLALILILAATGLSAQLQEKHSKALDKALEKITVDFNVPGYAVAVIRGKQVIYCKGFGYRDVENRKPVTPNTCFPIGSCTKAFTSALLGQLRNEGKVDFDAKARTYLPQLHFYTDALDNEVTVRDLMCHRTGLARYDYSWYMFNTGNRDSMLARIRYMKPTAGLREIWQYNNFMFLAQGMIAEKLTGKSWEQNIKERLLDPLEMAHSNTDIAEMQKGSDVSLPYVLDGTRSVKVPYYNILAMGPAGSINSNVMDMTHWVSAWLNGGKYNNREILPVNYIKGALRSQMSMGDGVPSNHPDIQFSEYGYAWMLHSYRGHYQAEHGGNVDGFTANVCLFPNDSLGFVILTNQGNSVAISVIRNTLSDHFLQLRQIDWAAEALKGLKASAQADPAPGVDSNKVLHTVPSHPLSGYTGDYFNPAYGKFKVYLKNDSLYTTAYGKDLIWLRHYHYDVFELIPDKEKNQPNTGVNLHMQFFFDDKGRIKEVLTPYQEDGIEPPVFKHCE